MSSYEVLYWDMPLCQARCNYARKAALTGELAAASAGLKGSTFACGAITEEDEDATWPGLRRESPLGSSGRGASRGRRRPSGLPDLITEHQNDIEMRLLNESEADGGQNLPRVPSSASTVSDEVDLDFDNNWSENRDLQRRLKKLTRSLSIKHSNHLPLRYSQNDVQKLRRKLDKSASSASGSDTTDTGSSTSASETIPLFDCIFIAGLYHDNIRNVHVPFTRDHFPEEFKLPLGIEELCWPDGPSWQPHTQDKTRTYTLVLTDLRGQRTFGYCRRIQAEGDDVCSPLAMVILTRHSRAKGLFSQILVELTKLYGESSYAMKEIYANLRHQAFPNLGQALEITATRTECMAMSNLAAAGALARRSYMKKTSAPASTPPLATSPTSSKTSIVASMASVLLPQEDLSRRRGSMTGFFFPRPFNKMHSSPQLLTSTRVKRIRRPIDFRMDGSQICSLLSTQQILLLCSTILKERRLVVISSSLSDLSVLFEGIESLIFPMTWQHTFIPALPPARTVFLEAPTPYLIGLLIEADTAEEDEDQYWQELEEESLRHDRDCLVIKLASSSATASTVLKRPRKAASKAFFPASVIKALENRMSIFDQIFGEVGLEAAEADRHRFVILCETFLHMYNDIFGKLTDYLSEDWYPSSTGNRGAVSSQKETGSSGLGLDIGLGGCRRPSTAIREIEVKLSEDDPNVSEYHFVVEEERDFDIVDYVYRSLDLDFHEFVNNLSQTAMFDEYLRSRIKAMGIEVVATSAGGTSLRLRRSRLQVKKISLVNRPVKLIQRRITLPLASSFNRRRKNAGGSGKRRVSAF